MSKLYCNSAHLPSFIFLSSAVLIFVSIRLFRGRAPRSKDGQRDICATGDPLKSGRFMQFVQNSKKWRYVCKAVKSGHHPLMISICPMSSNFPNCAHLKHHIGTVLMKLDDDTWCFSTEYKQMIFTRLFKSIKLWVNCRLLWNPMSLDPRARRTQLKFGRGCANA